VYAKYYFALRGLNERKNFRRHYMMAVNVAAPSSRRIEDASNMLKNQLYSRSL
jgi:hypothetical protein